MPAKVLLRAQSRGLLKANRQELIVTDDGVEIHKTENGKPARSAIRHDRIQQVRVMKGLFASDLEIGGANGSGKVIVQGLPTGQAEKARILIEAQMRATIRSGGASGVAGRLASWQLDGDRSAEELKARVAIVESEFQASRKELLTAIDSGSASLGQIQDRIAALTHDLREFKLLIAATTVYVSAQDHGGGIRGCVDVAEEILEEIQRRRDSPR